ncbi:f-box WD-40 domain-containing protein [Fusarium phyllophilum]|uniref:F-box WD-40 domain-containing protein n=1 Tax=Fusarium phyllophilum TaxID=47803 RepID=A0A8H5K7Y6_9HYPO|nr:f-box WD-40 domain-containing protein [Fusarium phyllophilum]
MTPSPATSQALEPRHPKPSQTVSVNISEGTQNRSRRFQLEVSECVETKTVTTTTRLTRKFPQVFVRDPVPLENLDTKEYPLAMKPTPPELIRFSYNMPGAIETDDEVEDEPIDHQTLLTYTKLSCNSRSTPTQLKSESPQESNLVRIPKHRSQSPSEGYPRRSRASRATTIDSPESSAPTSNPRRPGRSIPLNAVSDKLRRSIAHNSNRQGERSSRPSGGFLATPDTSEVVGATERSARRRSSHHERNQSPEASSSAVSPQYEATSPVESDSHTVFSSNVATPPITDADAEPFADADGSLQQPIRPFNPRPSIDVVAAQDASLPSPRLSPTLAAAQLHTADDEDETQPSFQSSNLDPSRWLDESQPMEDDSLTALVRTGHSQDDYALARTDGAPQGVDSLQVVDTQTLLEAFDSMKTEMKTFMMYQFLRRCPRPTLRVVANAVNPALKCDFLRQLPLELGYSVLSHLDHRDLCRAAQVSKHWRNIVDRNETGWKELFDRDGYTLPPGELQKAIIQGWGWQDPVGASGYEKDLSMRTRLTSTEHELTRTLRQETASKSRASKRKRAINTYSAERSKRRASAQEAVAREENKSQPEARQHKSEGPLSAANAAATAVPDPQLGLPSLRELHLYKSLYRRHHMIRKSWTSGEVKPGHVAFAAHPRHVITCLQFDEDKIITGSDDTLIHIYDTKTGKLRKKLEGHEGGVWALQYEGNMLVSGSTDRSVRVWDIERGLCQQVFYGHTSTVRCLQILMPTETGRDSSGQAIMQPEKPLIITGSRDSQLRVWRLPEVGSRRYIQTGPPAHESDCPYFIRVLAGHTHSVRAISAHGDTLVSGSYDSTVRVWRISTGEALHVLHGHSQKVYSVVLDHERNRCISGSMDSLVKIWDLATGACLYTLEGHSLLVGLLDLRDERLVSAAADSTLRIWDPENGKCRNTLMAHTGAITCFQHDGRKVISGSEKTVKMWDVRTGECVQDLLSDLSGVWQVKFDERRCVAAVQRDSLTYVEILDFGAVRDGKPPEELGKRILLNEPEVRAMIEEEA